LKILHFIATIEKIIVEGLVRLFKNNIWKLHVFLESVILNRSPQFAIELIKELNEILEIYYIQVHPSRNYIPTMISSLNYTSPPSTATTFLATYLLVVL